MEVNSYYTNFTFEEDLNRREKRDIQYLKHNSLFEFLFLWIEDDYKNLWSPVKYCDQYLNKIRELSGSCPQIVKPRGIPKLWWGNSLNKNEYEINSKVTSFTARNCLGLELKNSLLISEEKDFNKIPIEENFLFKKAFGFSGRGQTENQSKALAYSLPIIAEPKMNVVKNYGLTFLSHTNYFLIENFNDSYGQFKGGAFINKIPQNIFREGQRIFNWYVDKYNIDCLQIDMFSYYDNELLWNYLCEVNHRKTMGWILWKLRGIFDDMHAAIKIMNTDKLKATSEKVKIIELSPPKHKMKMFYFSAQSKDCLDNYLENLS